MQWENEVLARMYSLVADMEAMKALNTEREMRGESLAYSEESFTMEEKELQGISHQLRELT